MKKVGNVDGGIFVSVNAGKVSHPVGLSGVSVADIAMNAAGTRLFAVAYGSGVYVSPIPLTS